MKREAEARPGGPRELVAILQTINAERHRRGVVQPRKEAGALAATQERVAREIEAARHRLAVYGTLGPGQTNHHLIEPLGGCWSRGTVRGTLHRHGWGATMGFPALIWDPAADAVEVQLLESPALESAWSELDAFEGEAYLRILVPVELRRDPFAEATEPGAEVRVANLYALRRKQNA